MTLVQMVVNVVVNVNWTIENGTDMLESENDCIDVWSNIRISNQNEFQKVNDIDVIE